MEWAVAMQIEGTQFGTLHITDAEKVAFEGIKHMAYKLSPSLYEFDPRIGMNLAEELDWLPTRFPSCPLFDPPSPIRRPTTGFQYYRQVSKWCQDNRLPRTSHPGGTPLDEGCVFCRESVIAHPFPEEIIWGGGNIGWVHRYCAPWVDGETPRDLDIAG